ncbi:50S ribosomal protein L28 [Candidatus Fokinia solitaria]|uniref:Large ribosomal subunit protein bL28 n=1 Tax=Candidatus Fokinia solitaria TaxID=1802984 RepID=A0A2U8BSP8_9RICK|nr:50S ribosomal protein L28 [Candidatus Fokinia solitaria]AWD33300.1 50S ribosomal protein L28 [Candidatus Fokinia solitaria]
MPRRCDVNGKTVIYGNNVSHSNRRTRRRFLPNIQNVSVFSSAMQKFFRLTVSTAGLRTLDKHHGIDNYLLATSNEKLTSKLLNIKKAILANSSSCAE